MKSALCKNKNNINKKKKHVTFKDDCNDYENLYFTFLIVFVITSFLYSIL